jgi:hypothetical protein
MQVLCNLPRLPSGISLSASSIHSARRRFVRLAVCLLMLFWAGILLEGRAGAQYIPPASPPVCEGNCGSGSRSSSTESDEDRRARQQAWADARAERKAERDRQKAIRDAQKLAKKKAQDEARQQAEDDRLNAIASERAAVERAEHQRQLELEAQRRQAAFEALKPDILSGLKGVDGAPAGTHDTGDGLGLKGLDDAPHTASQPAWDANITDPEVAVYARRLDSVVPPLPIPEKEVSVTWKQIYLNNDRLLDTTDLVVTAWELTGVLGETMAGPADWILIGGKTLIAGENGAYVYLTKKDDEYNAAFAYLKNPAQAQTFARLVQQVRNNQPLPASADPEMVKAARAITAPQPESGTAIIWDSMTSKEALSAMLRKATIEVGCREIGKADDKVINDVERRKVLFDSVNLERQQARKQLLAIKDVDKEKDLVQQLTAVIHEADRKIAGIYRLEQAEKVVSAANGIGLGAATDKDAEYILGREAEGREY